MRKRYKYSRESLLEISRYTGKWLVAQSNDDILTPAYGIDYYYYYYLLLLQEGAEWMAETVNYVSKAIPDTTRLQHTFNEV